MNEWLAKMNGIDPADFSPAESQITIADVVEALGILTSIVFGEDNEDG